MSVSDDENPSLRLEGLVPKMEEFHNQAELLRVIWKTLYSTHSSRDLGTLFAARNLINARNVSSDPSGNYYASATMMDKFTDAYIIAGALEHFSMNELNGEPRCNTYEGDIGNAEHMRNYLLNEAKSFISKYVEVDIQSLPLFGPQSNCLACRYCEKKCKSAKKLRKHESYEHDHPDPVYGTSNGFETSVTLDGHEDKVLCYTKAALTLGLLRMNHNDAILLGDGKRIMIVNSYLFLLYKHNNCPKYAFGMLETLCQSKILLSERQAHRLVWNRVVNHRGKPDTNHPNDLDLEHCNKIFKDEAHSFRGIFTDKTISRVSRSALTSHRILTNYDRQTDNKGPSGEHVRTDTTEDVEMIMNQILQQHVFTEMQARYHQSFPNIQKNPFASLNMEYVRDWISQSLKKFAGKTFYRVSNT